MRKMNTWLFMSMAAINVPFLFMYECVPWWNAMAFWFCFGAGLTAFVHNRGVESCTN